MNYVKVRVPATTANLGPGFDCLSIALQLYNIVEIQKINNAVKNEVTKKGRLIDEKNLIYQATSVIFNKIKTYPVGVEIRENNQIPLNGGLGSSAAARIAGLVAANELMNSKLPKDEILMLATQLEGHCDNVASALLGGVVVSNITKKVIRYVKFVPPEELRFIVIAPNFKIDTKDSRAVLPHKIPFSDAVSNISKATMLVTSLATGNYKNLGIAMDDRLHQPYRKVLIPGMERVFKAAKLAGALGVSISGSGSSIVALANKNFKKIGASMRDAFHRYNIESNIMILNIDTEGTKILEKK